ncbi:MAG: pyruvate dehydrogenase (acetyl-transferring), homodimeric type [Polyangiaceae bacterium]|nr:pyruvate dehydrogenase (acetyl-transferring), homodimeric type [Myxococcales bacterium]MCB9586265.1 pyruvate dehydrogenase (acetyl-transferring), homodimeric type [Polyangiaceae bacterium]MCB9606942.1 pyruvate dehydrogenase (acetyl-transferring), homodimeric type [Polyangiaceae bacterium]
MHNYFPEAPDTDPQETAEWIESLNSVVASVGKERGRFLVRRILDAARFSGVVPDGPLVTDFVNTIPKEAEPEFPGDTKIERRIRQYIRWNAVAMVHRANVKFSGIGGHLSTYASSASLYEVGFNHFFRGKDEGLGDLVYYQGHAAPGVYARSFLEGRISLEQMEHFRREAERGVGLSSYPHPRLMPGYWEFPTVSMGLGPLSAIYQARFARYLHARGVIDTSQSRIWAFLGDGETDEPESLGSLSIAAREGLDNLIFVINCNLQRLDGPVRGNGKIVQELEALFRGAGWNVIKVIWAEEWDSLLDKDNEGVLRRRMNEVVDGQWQRYTTASGDYTRKDFFGTDPRLLEMVEHLSDEEIRKLRRGGHSHVKLYAAYKAAVEQTGRPTVILAHTVKGWTLGHSFEGSNVTHQKKKMELAELKAFRDLLKLPVPDDKLAEAPFVHPGMNSPEVQYMLERRRALGGTIPKRNDRIQVPLDMPASDFYAEFDAGMSKGEASTTMVFARLLANLIRDKQVGRRVVPIIPDEARTFGLDVLFSQVGIYSSAGQVYEPVDKGKLLYYRESKDGQVLEEGITEAGSMASFTAAGTAYSNWGQPMIPFYIYYSMFGFQRTGDQMWAFGDGKGRGFLLGATAGRTTLNGEGLQHEDGHSHILAAVIPNLRAYDVAFAYELATVIQDGMRAMYTDEEDCFYYITLQNENYTQPPLPDGDDVKQHIVKGMYRYRAAKERRPLHVQLWGSGSIMMQVIAAADILEERFGVSSDIWGVTSYSRMRDEALACERHNRLRPLEEARVPFISTQLKDVEGPFVAATDYMKLVPDQVARWVPGRLVSLGTDGFGMSDTREGLRRHFEVDAENIALAALDALRLEGRIPAENVAKAVSELGIDAGKVDPMLV